MSRLDCNKKKKTAARNRSCSFSKKPPFDFSGGHLKKLYYKSLIRNIAGFHIGKAKSMGSELSIPC